MRETPGSEDTNDEDDEEESVVAVNRTKSRDEELGGRSFHGRVPTAADAARETHDGEEAADRPFKSEWAEIRTSGRSRQHIAAALHGCEPRLEVSGKEKMSQAALAK
ncbi:unnamed protein product [Boreogadus saida]